MIKAIGIAAVLTLVSGCTGAKQRPSATGEQASAATPSYTANADSLYSHVERQMAFGPRTPGSEGHKECGDMIVSRLHAYGVDSVAQQHAPVTLYNGSRFTARNILGSINPTADQRILLLAHYDTRPWADNDPDPDNHSKPVPGANDGASGVAVLLETARLLGHALPDSIGVDLLFVDLEDSGVSGGEGTEETWCLGTQEWVKQMPYTAENRPRFGILLDMVGGADARFHREYFSNRAAPSLVNRVWAIAREAGYGDRFINNQGGAVVDDHLFINRAGIPCIDIIESTNTATGSFNPTWHTIDDDLPAIDRNTLKAVTQTVLNVIASPL